MKKWNLSDFTLDQKTGIFSPPESKGSFNYSDGTETESYIHQALIDSPDVSDNADCLTQAVANRRRGPVV